MVSTSVMTQGEALSGQTFPKEVQWQNYADAWEQSNFANYVRSSAVIALISVSGTVLFCTPAAYAFARMNFYGRNFLFALFLSTMMIPEAVTLIPNFLTVTWLGRISETVTESWLRPLNQGIAPETVAQINNVLNSLWLAPLDPAQPIGPLTWIDNWPALTIPFMASAFSIFMLRQFFAQIPDELWDAARIDGAGHLRFLVQIVVPISKAALTTVVLFAFIGSWNALSWPLIVTNTERWRPVSYGLSKFVTEAGPDMHLQMAGSVITIIPILVLYFFTQKQFTEGIATTGLKG
ncbi:MAG: carbohydrate ABC transporter permease [Anaerolineae bacterium]|nr:carbohydrate ABC transporter permease [Anaerolineae bacterium]